ncbi:unnamed protein product [Brugia pahangi]|uniref:Uncharacterized protein n=1 Tax=Brugia pahangi TaxID=6280 RepID=A0A0N4T7D1_BRUPA|nr:unnamed protein product [Brugia pahangi]
MEMKLLFAESKLKETETLKIELKSAHQINQQLRDEVSLVILNFFCYFKVPKIGILYSYMGKKFLTTQLKRCYMLSDAAYFQLQKRLEEDGSRSKSRFRSMELDTSQMLAEVVRLKKLLVQEERAKESAKAKARKFEDELMIERRRCTEFSAVFERAKKIIILNLLSNYFSKQLNSQQCEAAQHKYQSLLSVCQKQQSHILDLYARIEEIVALSNSERLVNIEPQMLFPRSSLSEMCFLNGSSQGSFFPSELFDEENENDKDSSDICVRDDNPVVSLSKNDPKGGVL